MRMQLRPGDLAKLAFLYLHHGRWTVEAVAATAERRRGLERLLQTVDELLFFSLRKPRTRMQDRVVPRRHPAAAHRLDDVSGPDVLRPIPRREVQSPRPPSTSRWTSHDCGATLLYQGQVVSLLWQSKHARLASSRVRCESQTGSLVTRGFEWLRPYGTACASTNRPTAPTTQRKTIRLHRRRGSQRMPSACAERHRTASAHSLITLGGFDRQGHTQ